MKRQNTRQLILLITLLLFPIVFYYLSPYLIIESTYHRILAGVTITFFVLFLLGLFLGRSFCGWVCPVGSLQDICYSIQKKPANQKFNWTKYLFWIPWFSLIIFILVNKGFYTKVDFFYQTDKGISLTTSSGLIPYITYYGVISLFLIITLFTARRGFCHYGCWVSPFIITGRWIANIFSLPRLSLKANANNCTHCLTCNKNCLMSLDVHKMVQKNRIEHSECILCGSCVDICPLNLLSFHIKRK